MTGFFLIFSSLVAVSVDLKAVPPQDFCFFWTSPQFPQESALTLEPIISERLGASCPHSESAAVDPFTTLKNLSQKPVFIFWAGKDLKSEETLIRAFDGESKLQFAMTRVKIDGLSAQSVVAIFNNSIDEMLKKFPYVGVAEKSGFWMWTDLESNQVNWAERDKVERHPFIPVVMTFRSKKNRPLAEIGATRLWASPDGQR